MRIAAYAVAAALVLLGGVVAWTVVRGEDTRRDVNVIKRTVTVDPCQKPRSESCQRRIALVLKALVKRHPDVLKDLGLRPKFRKAPGSAVGGTSPPVEHGGGGADNSPQGNGPTGRVRGPRPSPPAPPTPEPPKPPAPVDVDVPLPVDVCVDGLLHVNC